MPNRVEELQRSWAACTAADERKNAVVKGLFEQIEAQSSELADTERELLDKKDALQQIRGRESNAIKRIKDLERQRDRHIFAAVLIDGDNMPFKDDLVKQGFHGGRKTASLLKGAVNSHLEKFVPEASKRMINVVVHVFSNTKGLGKKYKEMDLLPGSSTFEDFVRGFNMGDELCHYTDAGDGKECADVKIIAAMFDFYRHDVHCHKILLCAPSDNGYARLLMPHLEDRSLCERISLLRGARFASELQNLHDKFRVTSFDDVFRRGTLPNFEPRAPLRMTPPTTPDQGYAAVAARGTSSTTPLPTTQGSLTSLAMVNKNGKPAGIERNAQGYRLDKRLLYSSDDYKFLKPQKLCNAFHILGKCPYGGEGSCNYKHGKRLPAEKISALRLIVRGSPCPAGVWCADPDCICGHHCVRDGHCDRSFCWFSDEMHDTDTRVATVL
ncbi:hypothetical protein TOPH_07015 [Tolypocladium ophioglossoides CBS 100239]|uniref:C3H1-type domain-containing protein n=1 Tax=Tolypocladium ophioglossoides (strain CBS 100239) TaxID=1163406 RepID=A0A0L0N2X8_TOLOC|nr:hypothetical protein TOPH_07015 [Tolypocladium ophioglossoides CBS 100239]